MKKVFIIFLCSLLMAFGSTFPHALATPSNPGARGDLVQPKEGELGENQPATGTGFSLEDAAGISDFKRPGNLPTLGTETGKDPVVLIESVFLNYVINTIFLLAGGVSVIVIMYSAGRIIIARGEEEGLTAAKNTLIWAFLGLLLIILAYTLVRNLAAVIIQLL